MSREITFAGALAGTTVTVKVNDAAAGNTVIAFLYSGLTLLATAQATAGKIRAVSYTGLHDNPWLWIGRACFDIDPSEAKRLAAFISEVRS